MLKKIKHWLLARKLLKTLKRKPLDLPSDDQLPRMLLDNIVTNYISQNVLKNYQLYHTELLAMITVVYTTRGYTVIRDKFETAIVSKEALVKTDNKNQSSVTVPEWVGN